MPQSGRWSGRSHAGRGRPSSRLQAAGLRVGREPPGEQSSPQGHARQHRRAGQGAGGQRHLAAGSLEGPEARGVGPLHLPGGPHAGGRPAEARGRRRLPGRPRCRGRGRHPRGGHGPPGLADQARCLPKRVGPPLPLADGRAALGHPQRLLPGRDPERPGHLRAGPHRVAGGGRAVGRAHPHRRRLQRHASRAADQPLVRRGRLAGAWRVSATAHLLAQQGPAQADRLAAGEPGAASGHPRARSGSLGHWGQAPCCADL